MSTPQYLGGGARGHPAQRSAGAAHAVAGQAQLAGGAVPRAARRPAVGSGLAACLSLGALPPQADLRGGLAAACRSGALIPVVTLIGLQLPILVGGAVIMENI